MPNHTNQQLLPSATSAIDFVEGKRGSTGPLLRDMFLRGLLCTVGINLLTGDQEPLKKGMAASVFIESFVLLAAHTNKKRR